MAIISQGKKKGEKRKARIVIQTPDKEISDQKALSKTLCNS